MKTLACGCTPCPVCKGKGYLYYDCFGGYSTKAHDDYTIEQSNCDFCEGSGKDQMCAEHQAAYDAAMSEGVNKSDE